mgnify:CR=1 FL=1
MSLGILTIHNKDKTEYNDSVIIGFNNKLSDEFKDIDNVVFDRVNLRFRESTIDDLKTIKLCKPSKSYITCGLKFPNGHKLLGKYEVELSECGVWYEMYKVE